METAYLDQYAFLGSPIHRIPASTKLAATIVLIFLILLLPTSWTWFYWPLTAGLIVAAFVSRIPRRFLLRRLMWLEVVILGMSASRLFGEGGLAAFGSLVFSATLCGAIVLLVGATTRFTDILATLSALGLPAGLISTLGLMYRYLFVLGDEAGRMKRARASRTFRQDRLGLWRSRASVVAQLFVRCAERAQRVHSAMMARGWQ